VPFLLIVRLRSHLQSASALVPVAKSKAHRHQLQGSKHIGTAEQHNVTCEVWIEKIYPKQGAGLPRGEGPSQHRGRDCAQSRSQSITILVYNLSRNCGQSDTTLHTIDHDIASRSLRHCVQSIATLRADCHDIAYNRAWYCIRPITTLRTIDGDIADHGRRHCPVMPTHIVRNSDDR
jgi:hypothetical protein